MMEKGRTLAFQVSEELFQKVKEYLAWYNTPDTQTLLIVNEDEFPPGLRNHCIRKIGGLSILHQLYCPAKIKEEETYEKR